MEFDNKTMALAKFLKVDPALIRNDYGSYFTVNERVVKDGETPEETTKLANDFRGLLPKKYQTLITKVMIRRCTQEEHDKAFGEIKEYLDDIKPKAKKRAEQLARLDTGRWRPPIKETLEDVYNRLEKDHWYVSNILYNLIKNYSDYNSEYTENLRRAWLGLPVNDIRKDKTIMDGEYLVYTDKEADEAEENYLSSLWDDMTSGVPENLKRYMDDDRFVEENSGNRGENLNGYDGKEESVEFEGTTYYIYRNN